MFGSATQWHAGDRQRSTTQKGDRFALTYNVNRRLESYRRIEFNDSFIQWEGLAELGYKKMVVITGTDVYAAISGCVNICVTSMSDLTTDSIFYCTTVHSLISDVSFRLTSKHSRKDSRINSRLKTWHHDLLNHMNLSHKQNCLAPPSRENNHMFWNTDWRKNTSKNHFGSPYTVVVANLSNPGLSGSDIWL